MQPGSGSSKESFQYGEGVTELLREPENETGCGEAVHRAARVKPPPPPSPPGLGTMEEGDATRSAPS